MARGRRLANWLATCLAHPFAIRASRGAVVQGPARVRGRLRLGRGTLIFRGLDCVGPVSIGEQTFVNAFCYLRPGVVIGNRVAIASHVKLITDSHEIGPAHQRAISSTSQPIVVEDGVWIGSGVVVLPGVRIGAGAVVAAGSVVTSDVAANTLVAGVPARVRRSLE